MVQLMMFFFSLACVFFFSHPECFFHSFIRRTIEYITGIEKLSLYRVFIYRDIILSFIGLFITNRAYISIMLIVTPITLFRDGVRSMFSVNECWRHISRPRNDIIHHCRRRRTFSFHADGCRDDTIRISASFFTARFPKIFSSRSMPDERCLFFDRAIERDDARRENSIDNDFQVFRRADTYRWLPLETGHFPLLFFISSSLPLFT